ncbi:unnamed protein product [Laminaria digitata]
MWEIVSCPDCACAHHEDNNDMPAFFATAVAEVEAALVAANAVQDQEAAVAPAAKLEEEDCVKRAESLRAAAKQTKNKYSKLKTIRGTGDDSMMGDIDEDSEYDSDESALPDSWDSNDDLSSDEDERRRQEF